MSAGSCAPPGPASGNTQSSESSEYYTSGESGFRVFLFLGEGELSLLRRILHHLLDYIADRAFGQTASQTRAHGNSLTIITNFKFSKLIKTANLENVGSNKVSRTTNKEDMQRSPRMVLDMSTRHPGLQAQGRCPPVSSVGR